MRMCVPICVCVHVCARTGSGAIASLALSNKMLLPSTLDSVKTDLGIESLPTQVCVYVYVYVRVCVYGPVCAWSVNLESALPVTTWHPLSAYGASFFTRCC